MAEDVQRTRGGNPRIKLAQRARGGIAGIGEQRLVSRGPILVELLKRFAWKDHLAAHLKQFGHVMRPVMQAQRDILIVRRFWVTSSPL